MSDIAQVLTSDTIVVAEGSNAKNIVLEAGGLTIQTTLDPELQRSGDAAVLDTLPLEDDRAATFSAVEPGTGRILRDGMSKVAVYCDQDGVRHRFSAVCKHMGCIVTWNDVESSWDCPCHGSRFDPFGKVITGPATKDLEPPK